MEVKRGGSVVKEKTTDDLRQELMTQPDIDSYIKENQEFFCDWSVSELLGQLYEKSGLSKAGLARKAGMSEVYLHQIFSGRRKPSRDRLLCLCIGLDATLDETQRLLKQAAYAQVYPKNKRDAIISHGIIHHTPLSAINDKLFAENERTLF
ncbi:helix-turn-helix domain-containing protein [Pseudoflavonifractor sp. MCC625]|nr:helix-turn-helix domain-containing protein [Pseudoflavonifractor sp. MCC625]